MALVKCPECGRDRVSSSDVACPECGFNIKSHFDSISVEEMREDKNEELVNTVDETLNERIEEKTESAVEEAESNEEEIDVEKLGYSRYQIIWDTMVSSIFIALACSVVGGFIIASMLSSPEYFIVSVIEGFVLCVPFFIMVISNILLSKKGIKAYSLSGKLFFIFRKTAKRLITINIVKFFIFIFVLIWEVVIIAIFLFFSAPITVLYYAIMYLLEKRVEFEDSVANGMDKVIPVLGCIVTTIYVFTNTFVK